MNFLILLAIIMPVLSGLDTSLPSSELIKQALKKIAAGKFN
jgi:hypothetical protein